MHNKLSTSFTIIKYHNFTNQHLQAQIIVADFNTLTINKSVKTHQKASNITLYMREAKRIFAKHRERQNNQSPTFRSKVIRSLPNQHEKSSLGPGQYDISLPIVKPRFQTIRKNYNTLIIKINENQSPAFRSIQPRFKQQKKEEHTESQNDLIAFVSINPQTNVDKNQKLSLGMKNRIKRLSEILQKEQIEFNNTLSEKSEGVNLQKLKNIRGSEEALNSLKLYKKEKERLHFLLKSMRVPYLSKGPQWSKYRQTKGNLYTINNVPGPGSYNNVKRSSMKRYLQTIDDKSWQFKSLTRRDSFMNKESQKMYEIITTRNKINSEIDHLPCRVQSIPLLYNNKSEDALQLDNQLI